MIKTIKYCEKDNGEKVNSHNNKNNNDNDINHNDNNNIVNCVLSGGGCKNVVIGKCYV